MYLSKKELSLMCTALSRYLFSLNEFEDKDKDADHDQTEKDLNELFKKAAREYTKKNIK